LNLWSTRRVRNIGKRQLFSIAVQQHLRERDEIATFELNRTLKTLHKSLPAVILHRAPSCTIFFGNA
jgi:hypothetical protein